MASQLSKDDKLLLRELGSYWDKPLDYVMFSWKWGEGALAGFDGPQKWQEEFLVELGKQVRLHGFDPHKPLPVDAIQMSTASGHGIGKSALVAMITCWILDTRPDSKGIITANTGAQLKTKTFAELSKWRKSSVAARFWDVSSGDMYVRSIFNPDNWRVDALTWKKERAEAFAGLHAATATPFYIFDEASAIDDKIFEVAQGGLTDGEPMWLMFGNPTRNKGFFFETFHKLKHRWSRRQIDSRNVEITNKRKLQQWIEDYGEDSDFVRIRVRGVFPSSGAMQFISNEIARMAELADLPAKIHLDEPVIVGVDVARDPLGDESVVTFRRGKDARTIQGMKFRGIRGSQLGMRIAERCNMMRRTVVPVAAIFVDITGVGTACYDKLEDMGYPVTAVNFGGLADRPERYHRKGDEMWGRLKAWLADGGCIEEDPTLYDQLTHREYGHTDKMQIKLQKKDDMRDEGVGSPDRADALSLTFAFPVAAVSPAELQHDDQAQTEYDYLAD